MNNELLLLSGALVTPAGNSIAPLANHMLERGSICLQTEVLADCGGAETLEYPLSQDALKGASLLPRLRRSSEISLSATTSALEAVKNLPEDLVPFQSQQAVLLYGSSDGGVRYTRRFFEAVQKDGPGKGSPLLFPETVYNAPASHVAATLGMEGEALSLVGDGAVAFSLLENAAVLLGSGCAIALAVAAEESDAISNCGYSAWGLARNPSKDSHRPADSPSGAIFTGGAGALILGLRSTHPNRRGSAIRCLGSLPYRSAATLRSAISSLCSQCRDTPEAVICSDAGTKPGALEQKILQHRLPGVPVFAPKQFLGEALSAATFWQLLLAAHLVEHKGLKNLLVVSTGYNGTVAGAEIFASAPFS